jgi:large subunit ribosomal protein L6
MEIKKLIEIPEGIEVSLGDFVAVKGPNAELKRKLKDPTIKIEKQDNNVVVRSEKVNKKSKRTVGTIAAHIRNMVSGAKANFVYVLKICSGHFPMNITIVNNEITIRNFLGEKCPRVMKIKGNVKIKLEKEKITIEGADIEVAGQAATMIEKLTSIKNRDRRRFQDGIFIIEKPK